jgi:leader peptidase (prepilin peptidase)/N-methyltransferase
VTVAFATIAGVTGLAIGSFLNVVAYRVPAGLSVVRPASACPGCGHEIRGRDNVPVISWLVLGGRCRDCRMSISARYPVLEALTGVAFLLVTLFFAPRIAAAGSARETVAGVVVVLAYLYLAAISIALSAIDLDVRRLPDAIVLPSYLVGGVLLVVAALLHGNPAVLIPALVGAVASLLFYGLLWFAKPGGMGFGDVKAAGLLGMYLGFLGWGQLAVGVAAAFVLGGVFGVALMIAGRAGRKTAVPFGPWMFAGAWVGIVAGGPLAVGYLEFVGLG